MSTPALMRASLEGLSVGDAFGERFFQPPDIIKPAIAERRVPAPAPWKWSDDTAMALSLVETLEARGSLNAEDFSKRLARRYTADPLRGYGSGARQVLEAIARGEPWELASRALYEGAGSKGNGAAMRVAPLGAFHSDAPLSTLVEEAQRSAAVTHAHPEGNAGAVAVALVARSLARKDPLTTLWRELLERTPPGATRDGLEKASRLGFDVPSTHAAKVLGSGREVLSEDTVPFSIWCALRHRTDYREALWTTVAGLGDRDTTCAIVGGLVGIHSAPPREWLESREPLP